MSTILAGTRLAALALLPLTLLASPQAARAACLPAAEVAGLIARDLAPRLNEVPFRLALRLPLPRESDVPPELLESFGGELVRALRNSGRVAKIIERARLAEIGRELRQYRTEDLARLGRDLEVDGLILLEARSDGPGVTIAADAIEIGNRATGTSIASSQSYCVALELMPVPLAAAAQALAKRTLVWAEAIGAPIGPRTRVSQVGRADPASARLLAALASRLQAQGDARTAPLPELRIRIDLHAGLEGMVEAHLGLIAGDSEGHLVERIREAGFTAPRRVDGPLLGRGRALIGELDRQGAMQAAKAQARADVIRQALGEPVGQLPPVARVGESRRLLQELSRGLTFKEAWTIERDGSELVEVRLEAEARRLDGGRPPRLEARLSATTFTPGEVIDLELRVGEPLQLAVYVWQPDGTVLRAFPDGESGRLELVPGKTVRPRFADGASLVADLEPGTKVSLDALIVVAGRGGFRPPADLAPPLAETVEESRARAIPAERFLDSLAALEPERLQVRFLPYEVVAGR